MWWLFFSNSGDRTPVGLIIVLSPMETVVTQFSLLKKKIYIYICTKISISNKMTSMDDGFSLNCFTIMSAIKNVSLLNGEWHLFYALNSYLIFLAYTKKNLILCLRPLAFVRRKIIMDQTSLVQILLIKKKKSLVQILTDVFSFLDAFWLKSWGRV